MIVFTLLIHFLDFPLFPNIGCPDHIALTKPKCSITFVSQNSSVSPNNSQEEQEEMKAAVVHDFTSPLHIEDVPMKQRL
jgi:hypothetical protein